MKKTIIVATLVVLVVAVAGVGFVAGFFLGGTGLSSADSNKLQVLSFTNKPTISFDTTFQRAGSNSVFVKSGTGQEKEFKLDKGFSIMSFGQDQAQKINLSDLKKGDNIILSGKFLTDSSFVVSSINLFK